MIHFGICEECSKEDILGYVACADQNLCPECAQKYTRVDSVLLRIYMKKQLQGGK